MAARRDGAALNYLELMAAKSWARRDGAALNYLKLVAAKSGGQAGGRGPHCKHSRTTRDLYRQVRCSN